MGVANPPRVATRYTGNALHGVDDKGCCLAQETTKTPLAVVEDDVTHTMGNLADGHTTHRRRDDIIDGRRVFLAKEFPHQRTTQCVECRLPEVHAIGTGHVEIEIAMIGVRKHVHDEDVVVPHKTRFQVVADGAHGGLGKLFLGDETIVELHGGVQGRHTCCCHPRMFLLRKGHDGVGGHYRIGNRHRIGCLYRCLLSHGCHRYC